MSSTTGAKAAATSGRVGAIVLLAVAIFYGIEASRIRYSFSSDPLGPRVFPMLLAGVLALLAFLYFLKPAGSEPWPKGRLLWQALAIPALVVAAALLLEPAGFGLAMLVLVTGVAAVFGASWRAAFVGGVIQAALWFLVFGYLLEVYLPVGSIFGH
jgi:putative tricarboxylic transport membrane protein